MFKRLKDLAIVAAVGVLAFSPSIWSCCKRPYEISGKILSVEELASYRGELGLSSGKSYGIRIDSEQKRITISANRLGQRTLQEGKDISLKVKQVFPFFGNYLRAVDVNYTE